MQSEVVTVRAEDAIETGLERLAERQIHRLPVVDGAQRLVGVFTLSDVARLWRREKAAKAKKLLAEKGWEVVAAIRQARSAPAEVLKPAARKNAGGTAKAKAPARKASKGGARKA